MLIVLGSIAGDIIGSAYEFDGIKDYNFDLILAYSACSIQGCGQNQVFLSTAIIHPLSGVNKT